MSQLRIYYIFIFFLFVLIGCKKIETTSPGVSDCHIYSNVNPDTNYIPHKKGNFWSYCYEGNSAAGFNVNIVLDTIIGGKIYFQRVFAASNSHSPPQSIPGNSVIDSLGNYYLVINVYSVPDTVLIIKPNAQNGDTIYKNLIKSNKVVLENKNETFMSIPGCHHIKIIKSTSNSTKVEHHYYKKGVGEIYFNMENITNTGYILTNSIIH